MINLYQQQNLLQVNIRRKHTAAPDTPGHYCNDFHMKMGGQHILSITKKNSEKKIFAACQAKQTL
jgi:hypothetical protein